MKWHISVVVITVLCLGLFCGFPTSGRQAQGEPLPDVEKLTVLNPLGTPPPVQLKSMAPRSGSLDGKTIYLVDNGYLGSDNLLKEMFLWLEENHPEANYIFKRQTSEGFSSTDPVLWAELKEKADGVIIGMGH